MDEEKMIDDLVKMLDSGMTEGIICIFDQQL